MITKKFTRGFTLIELLVVIAIIGVLSSVVLASLNTARARGANAAVKSNLNNMRAQAEIIYDRTSPNSYNTVCNATQDASIAKGVDSAHGASDATGAVSNTFATAQTIGTSNCHSSASAWAISVPLKVPETSGGACTAGAPCNYWCVDWTGTSVGRVNPLAGSSASCPAS